MGVSNKSKPIYIITFLLAACSIVYELLLAQTISFFSANTVVWYSLVIGVYLGSMGVGALFYHRIFKKSEDWESLINVELWLSLVGGLSVVLISIIHMTITYIWINNNFYDLAWVFYGATFLAVIAIGLLTGCELPLLIRLGSTQSENKSITNRILSIDYFGSLFGALIFPLVLIVHFELITVGFIVAFVNILVAGYLQVIQKKQSIKLTITTLLAAFLLIGALGSKHVSQYFLKKYYYADTARTVGDLLSPMNGWPKINRVHSPYQKIDLVYYPPSEDVFDDLWDIYTQKFTKDPKFPRGYVLFMDGFYQFLLDIENINHEYFAHVPIIFNDQVPKKVLVLGAGDGLLLRELVKYKDIESITLVEIDRKMVEIAKKDPVLVYANDNAFKDERIQVVIDDAFHYVRHSKETYDAVYMDFPRAKDYNLSKLYSHEIFKFIYNHLSDNGYIVFDASEIVVFNKENYWEIYYSTLLAAGFESVTPYFSTLENDNMEAINHLYPRFLPTSQLRVTAENSDEVKIVAGRERITEQIINDFISDHQNSFIVARKKSKEMNRVFKTFGVDHLILNEKRFALTLDRPTILNDIPTTDKVNTVMRPTLPRNTMQWNLRVPY